MSSTRKSVDQEVLEMAVHLATSYKTKGFSNEDIKYKLRKRFEDFEVSAALEVLMSAHESEDGSSLRESDDYYGWYQGPCDKSDNHWNRLKSALKSKSAPWSNEMIESLNRASTQVVSHLAPPHSENPMAVKGLVLGYIQSGKTANFSASIAKAVDEGYKLVIVLAGMHNNLRKQTELRLRQELVDPIEGKTCTTLTDVDDQGDFKSRQSVSANSQLHKKDGFTLVVLKKNATVLRNFSAWLSQASDDVLKACPALIIDDEADQASVNTNKAEDDPTAINNHIRTLLNLFEVSTYVGYTATPFANVFIDADLDDDIYPKDFLVTLEKPSTYYGPEELFGRANVDGKAGSEGLPIIREVPRLEAASIRKDIKDKNMDGPIPLSLEKAIQSFIVGGSIRLCRGQWKEHITMLTHLSHLTLPQEKTFEAIEELITDYRFFLETKDGAFRDKLYDIWRTDFAVVTKAVTGSLDHEFSKVYKNARKLCEKLEIIMDNSQSDERLTFDRSLRGGEPLWGIVVGGNTLSRGLTLEGLTSSYFIRNSKAYDTLLQMGRWFGFRKGYADLTRIFMPKDLEVNFYNLATVEQEIREEIKLMSANKEKPKHVALQIRKIPGLNITTNNKMRSAVKSQSTYSGLKVQTHQIIVSDAELNLRNEQEILKLLKASQKFGRKEDVQFTDLNHSHLYRDVQAESIMQFLDKYNASETIAKFNSKGLQSYISNCNHSSELKSWSVALMSKKEGEKVSLLGHEVTPLTRKVKHEQFLESGHIEATLRAVSTPGDELIDLHSYLVDGVKTTDDVLKPRTDDSLTDVQVRKSVRPPTQGLIMIYPLESNLEMSSEDYNSSRQEHATSYTLCGAHQLYAVSIVFPQSEKETGAFNYYKNSTV